MAPPAGILPRARSYGILHLTYCGNVHPTPDLAALLASLQQHSAPVARAAARAGRRFGLGAWWPMPLAQELAASPAALAPLAAALHAAELPLWTLNVFPFGDFHGDIVKTAV